MKGIEYLIDEKGKRKAVVISYKEFGEYWEEIEDILVAYQRAKEPRIPIEKVKQNLIKQGKL